MTTPPTTRDDNSEDRRSLPVDRCVCANVTFAQMKELLQREGGGLDALRTRWGCGGGCAMCVPYLHAMLRTGRTRFAVNDAAVIAEPYAPDVHPPSL